MPYTYTPLRYPGGKTQFYDRIVNIFCANNIYRPIYIEPFAGGAGLAFKLLLNGKVSKIVINDLDECVYSFWKTAINNKKWLINKIKTTEITISEWKIQKTFTTTRIYILRKKLVLLFYF